MESPTPSSLPEPRKWISHLFVINPNSSKVITDALEKSLMSLCPPGVKMTFVTGPPESPPSIIDPITSIQSATSTFNFLSSIDFSNDSVPVGFLIACFSSHPLVPMLQVKYPSIPSLHILTSSVLHSLPICQKFGIITSMSSAVEDCEKGVRETLGSGNSWKYVGTVATDLGVVELQTGDKDKIERVIKEKTRVLLNRGADTVILGCAGFSGMEHILKSAVKEGENPIAVVDGAKAGLQLLAGIVANNYRG